MSTQEKVLERMASLLESAQAEVLQFIEALCEQHEREGAASTPLGKPGMSQEIDQATYDAHVRQILQERLARHEANPHLTRPAEEVEAEIRARFGWE